MTRRHESNINWTRNRVIAVAAFGTAAIVGIGGVATSCANMVNRNVEELSDEEGSCPPGTVGETCQVPSTSSAPRTSSSAAPSTSEAPRYTTSSSAPSTSEAPTSSSAQPTPTQETSEPARTSTSSVPLPTPPQSPEPRNEPAPAPAPANLIDCSYATEWGCDDNGQLLVYNTPYTDGRVIYTVPSGSELSVECQGTPDGNNYWVIVPGSGPAPDGFADLNAFPNANPPVCPPGSGSGNF